MNNFAIHIKTNDFYNDIKEVQENILIPSPLKKEVGLMEDELGGEAMN